MTGPARGLVGLVAGLIVLASLLSAGGPAGASPPASPLAAVGPLLSVRMVYTIIGGPFCVNGASYENATFIGFASAGSGGYSYIWTFPNTSVVDVAIVNMSLPSVTAWTVTLTALDSSGDVANDTVTVPASATTSASCGGGGSGGGLPLGAPGNSLANNPEAWLYYALLAGITVVAAVIALELIVLLRRRRRRRARRRGP